MSKEARVVLSRPGFQRTELGPVITTIVPEVLQLADLTELPQNTNLIQSAIETFEDEGDKAEKEKNPRLYGLLAAHFIDVAIDAVNEWGYLNQESSRLLALQKLRNSPVYDKYMFRHPLDMLTEGVTTGLLMPLKLHAEMNIKEKTDGTPVERASHINIGSFVSQFAAPGFLDILHRYAHAPPGFLGPWANEWRDDFKNEVISSSLKRDKHGVWYLGEEYDTSVRAEFRAVRNRPPNGVMGASGGCPVRHAAYPVVTSWARRALWEDGVTILELAHSQTSAITLCQQFVVKRCTEIFEAADYFEAAA